MATLDPERYQDLLSRLRKARLDAGLTQVQVSLKLGQHQSFISRCETGERRVDFVEMQILAEIYGKELSFFVSPKRSPRGG